MVMNLVVAVFYNEYRNQIEKKIKKYDKTREVFIKKQYHTVIHLNEGNDDDVDWDNIVLEELHVERFENFYVEELRKSPKVVDLLIQINYEIEHGISDGMLDFEAFSLLYMMLDHKSKDSKKANKSEEGTGDQIDTSVEFDL